MTFADKIRNMMRERGLTQVALGEELGVTQRAVGGWLDGARPHQRKSRELAEFFGLSVEVLLDDNVELPHAKQSNPRGGAAILADEGPQGPYAAKDEWVHQMMEAWDRLPLNEQADVAKQLVKFIAQRCGNNGH